MPITFSAGSFSFLKSSATSQSNIEQNNTVDNVNKSNINNININDNLDFGNNSLNERKVRSLDISTSFKNNNRRNSNASSNLKNANRKWLKSIFARFLSRWNDGDDDDDGNNNTNLNNSSNLDDNNPVKNNEIDNVIDDGVIMMKSRGTIAVENQKNAFIHHGNTHDFYIVTNGTLLKSHPSQQSLSSVKRHPSSSVFEKCAKTPRHYAKESEVLGTVGRFTILREREDFDTTYFDTCHCQQKPCRFPINGGCGTHPISPELIPNECDDSSPISIPTQRSLALASSRNTQQQQHAAAHHHMQLASSRTIYCHPTPSSTSSRRSLPSLQNRNSMASKAASSTTASSSICVLPQSASSPNLVHLNQRLKNENKINTSRMSNNGRPIIICNNSGKYSNHLTNNGSYHHPQSTTTSMKAKKPSLVNIRATESEQRRLSMPSTSTSTSQSSVNHSSAPSTPTSISKFSLSHHHHHHHPNEPHTTINSHSGRKFEVEWTCSSTTARSSTSSTSSTFSSEPASSPPSSISSMASSPDRSIKSTTSSLSRRCSTLSSKCGRKFEVTILSSSTSSTNGLYTTSPHSTINSVISMAETTAEST